MSKYNWVHDYGKIATDGKCKILNMVCKIIAYTIVISGIIISTVFLNILMRG